MLSAKSTHSELIAVIRDPLVSILGKYYEVDGNTFPEIDKIVAIKHQSFHLSKLIKKLVLCETDNSTDNAQIVINEVAPDLIIYAQELMIKYDVDFPRRSMHSEAHLLPLKFLIEEFSIPGISLREILRIASVAAASLGDICDQYDHRQKSVFDIKRDVIRPFLSAAASLTDLFNIDIDKIYARRLEQMIEKYESWHN